MEVIYKVAGIFNQNNPGYKDKIDHERDLS